MNDNYLEFILIFTFFIAMFSIFFYFSKSKKSRQLVASIITVIGILGTFVGIAIGLYMFDEKNIQESVPNLLAGLKIAFITSIFGIFLSIVIKLQMAFQQYKVEKQDDHVTEGATIDDLANILSSMHYSQKEEGEKVSKSIQSMEKALTGEGETTVVTQLQKLRTTVSDKQDDLIKAFNTFAEQVAENNSKALIEALKEVIRDFNAKINEQFGDNFKQLNEAVHKILLWQHQYRKQMDQLANEFRIAADSVNQSEKSLAVIAAQCDSINSNAQKLEPILTTLNEEQKFLNDNLSSFSALRDKAKEAFPIIEERLTNLTDDFSKHVNAVITKSNAAVENMNKALSEQANRIDKTLNDISQNVDQIMVKTNSSIEGMYKGVNDRIEKQLISLDEELSRELTQSLQSLGSQLTSLSNKFVQDYSPLTDKLNKIVRISEGISNV